MRRFVIILTVLMLASAAFAAEAPRNGGRPPPVNQSRPAAPLPAPLPQIATPAPSLASGGLPAPAQSTDPRPQCRAQCAKARYSCASDDTGCDDRWTQCLTACAR